MILVIDIGNTNIVFGLYEGDILRGILRVETELSVSAKGYAGKLLAFLESEHVSVSKLKGSIIASVVPGVDAVIKEACRICLKREPVFVSHEIDMGLKICYENPKQAGIDRIVNSVAAFDKYNQAVIVIDFGTATTFDIIDAEGAYCGGVIAPGPHLSMEALYQAAAKLPRVGIEQPPNVIGKNTVHAMQSGLFWGYVSMIEGLLDRLILEMSWEMDEETSEDPCIIATGGLATLFSSAIPAIETVDNDLTLRGLSYIHYHSRN